jgi:hypothetical protein
MGNIGVDDLFRLGSFLLGCGDSDRGNIGYKYSGLLNFFEDHPRQVGAARNSFAVLVEVQRGSGFTCGWLLDFKCLLELFDRRGQGVADKMATDPARRIGLP